MKESWSQFLVLYGFQITVKYEFKSFKEIIIGEKKYLVIEWKINDHYDNDSNNKKISKKI